jgi:hypothetical protein
MALFKSKSKMPMEDDQMGEKSLPLAYSVQRQSKKKMARGGIVEGKDDKGSISRNSGDKAPGEDKWTDTPGLEAAGKLSPTKLSQPKTASNSSAFDRRSKEMHMDEHDIEDKFAPAPYDQEPSKRHNEIHEMDQEGGEDMQKPHSTADAIMRARMARGGMVKHKRPMEEDMAEHMEPLSIADGVMQKRKMMAEGGAVDLEDNQEEVSSDLSPYDDRNEAVLKEHYGDELSDLDHSDSDDEHGDDIEADIHDMVSQIRKKMMSKRS